MVCKVYHRKLFCFLIAKSNLVLFLVLKISKSNLKFFILVLKNNKRNLKFFFLFLKIIQSKLKFFFNSENSSKQLTLNSENSLKKLKALKKTPSIFLLRRLILV